MSAFGKRNATRAEFAAVGNAILALFDRLDLPRRCPKCEAELSNEEFIAVRDKGGVFTRARITSEKPNGCYLAIMGERPRTATFWCRHGKFIHDKEAAS